MKKAKQTRYETKQRKKRTKNLNQFLCQTLYT